MLLALLISLPCLYYFLAPLKYCKLSGLVKNTALATFVFFPVNVTFSEHLINHLVPMSPFPSELQEVNSGIIEEGILAALQGKSCSDNVIVFYT